MAEKPGQEEGQFAWDADMSVPKPGGDPSDSGMTYRLASPSQMSSASEPVTRVPTMDPAPRRRIATKDQGNRYALMGYNLLIFVTSVCVMTLELTASRIISKHLGNSLYTWTSVIGVILAGITLGNWLGGWLSDRYDRYRALGWMYLLGSISSGGVLFLEQLVNVMERPASVSWPLWVLSVVALLFLLPALALGATSPLIASLALSRSNRLGATVGNVYAWGACGSIVGTFLTGFYLMDVLGSRAIIGLVAATLAVLAVVIAGRRNVFRTAVLCGWMQFFLFSWLAATATSTSWSHAAYQFAGWINVLLPDPDGARLSWWHQFGNNVGQKMHDLGLALELRDDLPGRYYDESQYSYIQISEGRQEGAPVKILRLDKLIHSYYNPAEPYLLHYDYEKIYAAVTKTAAVSLEERLTIPVPSFPGWNEIREKLPADIYFDDATKQLTTGRMDSRAVDSLLDLAPDADYWFAVDQLSIMTTQPGWGGLEAQRLERLPDGVTIPADLDSIIRYDAQLKLLNAYAPVTPAVRDRLIQASPRGPWHTLIGELRKQSGKFNSFFIGGGGYIFPRWLAHEFPGSTRIDVAEIDPAVRDAVVSELGLTPEDEARIASKFGDARQVVDETLRENRNRQSKNEPPVLYDFIYGDAFNDFSVPWHLTTLEFQEKLQKLMSPRGVLQVNMIDIYPRSEFPGRALGQAVVKYNNFLPKGLLKREDYPSNQFIPVLSKFGKLEINCLAAGQFELRASEELSDYQRKMLLNVDRTNTQWTNVVHELVNATRQSEPFGGEVPAALVPRQLSPHIWLQAADVDAALELQQGDNGKFALGYRGGMTDVARQKLVELAPQDAVWREALTELQRRSNRQPAGQFLGRFVYTASLVFPNIYLFATSTNQVSVSRDTFVIVCSQEPLNLKRLDLTNYWSGKPFASLETKDSKELSGQMESVLALAKEQALTDDFAPVENLLLPIFAGQ